MCSVLAARPVGGGGFILCPWRVTGVERAGDGRCERGKPTGWMGPQPPTCRVVNPAWQSCRRKGFLGSGLPCCPEHHGRRVPPLDLMLRTALHHGPGLLWLCALQGSWTSRRGHWISSMHCSASQPYAACCTVRFHAPLTVWTFVRVCSLRLQCPVVLCPVVVLPFVSLRLSSVSSVLRDRQTTVLCRACGLSWNRAWSLATHPCAVPTDGVLPRRCICVTWPL